MNTELRDVDYDRAGRIVRRCRHRIARLHAVRCDGCGSEWRAEHPFCERIECPDCNRLIQVVPDAFESECYVPSELLPAEELFR